MMPIFLRFMIVVLLKKPPGPGRLQQHAGTCPLGKDTIDKFDDLEHVELPGNFDFRVWRMGRQKRPLLVKRPADCLI
jgi:hypothetical protein